MPANIDQLRDAVGVAQLVIERLERHFPAPALVEIGGRPLFRHTQQDDLLLSHLKCVRAVSSLNACLLLLEHGYVQEIGTLCRCVDDFSQDVLFLATPLGDDGKPSEQQKRLVEEFFQEEFDQIESPLRSTQARNRVPRSKVLAGIARMSGQPLNPNDSQELHRTIQQAFSGYVHGAYVHIMEMFGGRRGHLKYYMQGFAGTPRVEEWTEALSSYVYRTLCAVEVVARRCTDAEAEREIRGAREALGAHMGGGNGDPVRAFERLKSR